MFVDSEGPDRAPNSCLVCGKVGVVMPSYPIADACCPYCGSLIFCKPLPSMRPHAPYDLLPDTAENRRQAEEVANEHVQLWEDLRSRRT